MSSNSADQHDRSFLPPESDAAPGAQADELLMHGMLGALNERAGNVAGRRTERVMNALREQAELDRLAGPTTAVRSARVSGRRVFGRRISRFVGVPVLALTVTLGAIFLVSLPDSQARAAVIAAASEVEGPGNRRFEVHIMRESDTGLSKDAEAVFDTTGGGHYLLRARHPLGFVVCVGQDAAGEWAIRPDGGIERNNPRLAWPRWSTDRGESLFLESVGTLMKSLSMDYRLKDEGIAQDNGKRVRHIIAMRRAGTPRPLADRVELWIDVDSSQLERMEMNWDRPPGLRDNGERPQPAQDQPPAGAATQAPREDASAQPAPAENASPAGGHPDQHAQPAPEGRPGPEGGPDRGPAGGPEGGPEGRPDRPFPAGPEGRPFPGPRGPRPGPDGRLPEGQRPMRGGPLGSGPNGPGPNGQGPMEGPMGEGRPEGGPPGDRPLGPRGMMRQGPRGVDGPIPGKAPRKIVIQRVEPPTWPADWFLPESHLKGEWGEESKN